MRARDVELSGSLGASSVESDVLDSQEILSRSCRSNALVGLLVFLVGGNHEWLTHRRRDLDSVLLHVVGREADCTIGDLWWQLRKLEPARRAVCSGSIGDLSRVDGRNTWMIDGLIEGETNGRAGLDVTQMC